MLRLRDKTRGASWWVFKVPHTGHTLSADNWFALNAKIRAHLDANDFKDAVISEDVVEEECARRAAAVDPANCFESPPEPVSERRIQLGDVIRLSRTLLLNLARGGKRVDQAEADRRGEICAGCQYNVAPGGCGGCSNSGFAAATVGVLVGDRVTTSDSRLQSCQFCGCFNKAQVWFPAEDLRAATEKHILDQLPPHCWKGNQP